MSTENGKLRCDKDEMEWLVKSRAVISTKLTPMLSELSEARRKLKNLRGKCYRNPGNAEAKAEIDRLKGRRES